MHQLKRAELKVQANVLQRLDLGHLEAVVARQVDLYDANLRELLGEEARGEEVPEELFASSSLRPAALCAGKKKKNSSDEDDEDDEDDDYDEEYLEEEEDVAPKPPPRDFVTDPLLFGYRREECEYEAEEYSVPKRRTVHVGR